MKEDLHYRLEELGYTKVVRNTDELERAIKNIDELKVGFHFENTLAIRTLEKRIEIGGHRGIQREKPRPKVDP